MIGWRRLVWLVTLCGVVAALLAGCGPSRDAQPSDMARDQTLKLGYHESDAFVLDPALLTTASAMQVASLLFDGLVTLDRNAQIEPWGAASWTISPDGLTYTFRLRPNQRFSDGAPVTASDYAWSIDRLLDGCAGSANYYELAVIADADALSGASCTGTPAHGTVATLVGHSLLPDDGANTLTIRLARPAGYFLAALATSAGMALERRVVGASHDPREDTGNGNPFPALLARGATGQGGSGMFYLARWSPTDEADEWRLTLRPNLHWWGVAAAKKPHFSAIVIAGSSGDAAFSDFMSDSSVAFASVLASNWPPSHFAGQPFYHAQPATATRALLFSWSRPPFDDLNARKAFCLAINRDQFNQQDYQGEMLPGWHIIPQGMPGYNPNATGLDGAPITGDAALAGHYWNLYLDAHHQQAPQITIDYGMPGESGYQQQSAWLQQAWRQTLGVTTVIDQVTWGMGPGWQASRMIVRFGSGDGEYVDPQTIFSDFTWFVANGIAARTMAAPVAAILQRADALSDMAQRIPLYQQAEQALIDNVALCPLYQEVNYYALRPWVKGDFIEDGRGVFPNDAWVTGYIARSQ
jgi:peptide/nickel transport system substrate-binding protein/oligopeptide transport system substrate-binding protein